MKRQKTESLEQVLNGNDVILLSVDKPSYNEFETEAINKQFSATTILIHYNLYFLKQNERTGATTTQTYLITKKANQDSSDFLQGITEHLAAFGGGELLFKQAHSTQLIHYQISESANAKENGLGEIHINSNCITLQGIKGKSIELVPDGDFEPHVIGGRGMAGNMALHLIAKQHWKQRAKELAKQASDEGK